MIHYQRQKARAAGEPLENQRRGRAYAPHTQPEPPLIEAVVAMLKLRQQIVRSAVRAQRATDWEAISTKLTDPRARAALDSLRSVHGEIQAEAREYLKEPEAIDFDHYRSIIKNKDLVNALEVRMRVYIGVHMAHIVYCMGR